MVLPAAEREVDEPVVRLHDLGRDGVPVAVDDPLLRDVLGELRRDRQVVDLLAELADLRLPLAVVQPVEVLEVVVAALAEDALAFFEQLRVRTRHRTDVEVAVEHPLLDPHRRRDGEHPAIVLREGDLPRLLEDGLPRVQCFQEAWQIALYQKNSLSYASRPSRLNNICSGYISSHPSRPSGVSISSGQGNRCSPRDMLT